MYGKFRSLWKWQRRHTQFLMQCTHVNTCAPSQTLTGLSIRCAEFSGDTAPGWYNQYNRWVVSGGADILSVELRNKQNHVDVQFAYAYVRQTYAYRLENSRLLCLRALRMNSSIAIYAPDDAIHISVAHRALSRSTCEHEIPPTQRDI